MEQPATAETWHRFLAMEADLIGMGLGAVIDVFVTGIGLYDRRDPPLEEELLWLLEEGQFIYMKAIAPEGAIVHR